MKLLLILTLLIPTVLDRDKAMEYRGGEVQAVELLAITPHKPLMVFVDIDTLRRLRTGTATPADHLKLHQEIQHALGVDTTQLRECQFEETVDTLTGFIRPTPRHHCRDLIPGREENQRQPR